mmetsp:Transcript_9699/g.34087  ORF Transcript_9699/g.34087 Transcript_9699/m.34087 type:complete len:130 (+) Transcript_9699:1021-1410(+)
MERHKRFTVIETSCAAGETPFSMTVPPHIVCPWKRGPRNADELVGAGPPAGRLDEVVLRDGVRACEQLERLAAQKLHPRAAGGAQGKSRHRRQGAGAPRPRRLQGAHHAPLTRRAPPTRPQGHEGWRRP